MTLYRFRTLKYQSSETSCIPFVCALNRPEAMSVAVLLDKPQHCFTNLDFISGRVILQIPYNETISAIVVKLEGESKTRLITYVDQLNRPSGREHAQLEVHKVSEYLNHGACLGDFG